MNCRDCRSVADSFLSDELLTETNHQILQHLDTCLSCGEEIAVRRHVRDSLRAAFDRAPEHRPPLAFAERLRDGIRVADREAGSDRWRTRRWLMLAAAVLLTAGASTAVFIAEMAVPVDALARDAIGSHWSCALRNRRVRTPVSLQEAAQRFDSAYRVLLEAPPDEIATPDGPVRVVDRHSCVFGARRFGHVILRYHDHVVSLLVTADNAARGVAQPSDVHLQRRGDSLANLSVASIHSARHAILFVSDLDPRQLSQLSRAVSTPLLDQLVEGPLPHAATARATFHQDVAVNPLVGRGL